MGEIEQYFDNYKKRRLLPELKVGTAKTIANFYDDCIAPALIPKENVIMWHKMFMQYIERDDAIFLLRRYENGSKAGGRWNTRRSAMTRFADGFTYVYVSNFEAHEIYNMAFKGVVPTAEEFARLLNNHIYPMHYDNGRSRSCEEIDISAYPHIGTVRSGVLNESKYYLAHIFSVNGADYLWDVVDDTIISKEEINEIAPRGMISDWEVIDGYPIRKFDYSLNAKQKAYVIAHFLRLLDPLNYFLTPIKALTSVRDISWNQNIGEYPKLVGYVFKVFEERFGKECIEKYCEKAMILPMKVSQIDLGNISIGISYGATSQNRGQSKARTKVTCTKEKRVPKLIVKNSDIRLKQVPIILEPNDVETFKKLLLSKKQAKIKLMFSDGHIEIKDWNARSFTEKSDVLNNVRSKSWWREKDTLGIVKVEVKII